MVINLNRGPFLNIPDKLHPGQYRVIKKHRTRASTKRK